MAAVELQAFEAGGGIVEDGGCRGEGEGLVWVEVRGRPAGGVGPRCGDHYCGVGLALVVENAEVQGAREATWANVLTKSGV